MHKVCTKCQIVKTLAEFHVRKMSPDGYRTWCRVCRRTEAHVWRRDKVKSYDKNYYAKNREARIAKTKRWIVANPERRREGHRRRCAAYRLDTNFKLSENLRNRLNNAIKTDSKGGSAVRNLGCSIAELKQHLERQFQPGMTWQSWGRTGWHIDHVIPLSSFDLTNPEHVKIACHFSNLQPLWATENIRKSDKVTI